MMYGAYNVKLKDCCNSNNTIIIVSEGKKRYFKMTPRENIS